MRYAKAEDILESDDESSWELFVPEDRVCDKKATPRDHLYVGRSRSKRLVSLVAPEPGVNLAACRDKNCSDEPANEAERDLPTRGQRRRRRVYSIVTVSP